MLADGRERREIELSMTSSWSREAVWISSVISASRRWEGRISELAGVSSMDGDKGLDCREEGFVSERIVGEEMGSSIIEAVGIEGRLGAFDVVDIARDMRRTSKGRTCFPSDLV